MIITDFQQLEPFRYKTGIYLFTNKIEPDRHYGGKSVNLYKRIALEHKNGKDHSKQYIDRVIKKHGLLEYFTIELIHWCPIHKKPKKNSEKLIQANTFLKKQEKNISISIRT